MNQQEVSPAPWELKARGFHLQSLREPRRRSRGQLMERHQQELRLLELEMKTRQESEHRKSQTSRQWFPWDHSHRRDHRTRQCLAEPRSRGRGISDEDPP